MLRLRKTNKVVIVAVTYLLFLAPAVTGGAFEEPAEPNNLKSTVSAYTWNQNVTGDWQSPSNWTPARTSPASTDILVFDLGGTTTVTNVPTQSIGQLIVSGNTVVKLQSASPAVLTILGNNSDDLSIASGSALNFDGSNAITINVASGATGNILGSVTFSSPMSASHRLTGFDANSITFGNGAIFTAGQGFVGNPFGTTNLNSIVFESGSTYVRLAGEDPFGAAEPASVVVFKTGSLFSLRSPTLFSQSSFYSGRTYANFEFNYPGYSEIRGTSALVMDDLTVKAGQLDFDVNGSPGHSIKGNITVLQGCGLDFQSSFPGHTINLNGDAPQTLNIRGQIGVNPGNTLAIDNPSGITVNTFYLAWNLQLISGVVKIQDPLNYYFHVPGTVTRVNGYIAGSLLREIPSPGTVTFDVGTANGYSPVTLEITAGNDFPAQMIVGAFQPALPNITDPSKALSRHWILFGNPNLSGSLTFNYLDPTDIPATANESNFVIQRYYNGFTQPSGVIDTQANTFRAAFSTESLYSYWTLSEPGAVPSPTATATPTASPTATSTPLAVVSGTITYGNAIGAPATRFVSNVTVTGTGPSTIFTTTIFPNGDYSLTGFQPGAYSVAPSKTGGVNGITSFDAGRIAQHVAGINSLTGNQLVVADVSGNGTISSFDAGQIAKYVAGLSGFGATANWIFTPANRSYASITGNIAGEDFTALLMGEVSGNWTNTGAR